MTCTLYGQVDIELSGTKEIEVVLEGELSAVQLKGEINIELDSNENIYLSSIINHPKLNAELGLVVNLDGCLTTESTYINAIAKPCCNGDAITVQVLETNQPTVNTILNNYSGHGFIYNGECYQFTSVGGGGVPVDTVLPSDYFLSICTNSICPECTTPTPTITPTQTQTPTTSVTQTPTSSVTQTPTTSVTQTPTTSVTQTPTTSVTSTPTPTTTSPCTNCDQYLIVNNDKVNSITVSYVNCNDGSSLLLTVGPDDSKPICSCTTPTRVGGSTNYSITNQGTCGLTPTPTSTATPTPTPTLTRTQTPTPTPSSSQTSCVAFELEWSFNDSDACNGVGLSTNTYYTSSPFTVGNTLYQNDTCTTSVSGGRYVIYNSNVYYINNGTIENHTC